MPSEDDRAAAAAAELSVTEKASAWGSMVYVS